MQQNFKEQFENLRVIINTNIATLKSLISQSNQLSQLIDKLSQDNSHSDLQKQLEGLRDNMSGSIEVLVKQNQNLFDTYDKLLEKVFGK